MPSSRIPSRFEEAPGRPRNVVKCAHWQSVTALFLQVQMPVVFVTTDYYWRSRIEEGTFCYVTFVVPQEIVFDEGGPDSAGSLPSSPSDRYFQDGGYRHGGPADPEGHLILDGVIF